MPDSRTHRGPDPRDAGAFGPEALPALRAAVAELSWLLDRGYAPAASLKLVGDRWSLRERQRLAVLRCACPDDSLRRRLCRRIEPEEAAGRTIVVDGFNLLTTLEAALGGAVVLRGRDGCLRDLAGVHGTYRRVEETSPAVALAGEALEALGVGGCLWLLDRPVSNSGRLRSILLSVAEERRWGWRVELVNDPDPILAGSAEVVVTADRVILDAAAEWLNLAREVVAGYVPSAWVVDLSAEAVG